MTIEGIKIAAKVAKDCLLEGQVFLSRIWFSPKTHRKKDLLTLKEMQDIDPYEFPIRIY